MPKVFLNITNQILCIVFFFFFSWACSVSYSVATGEACDCSGNTCTDDQFCYEGVCNSNAKGIPKSN